MSHLDKGSEQTLGPRILLPDSTRRFPRLFVLVYCVAMGLALRAAVSVPQLDIDTRLPDDRFTSARELKLESSLESDHTHCTHCHGRL